MIPVIISKFQNVLIPLIIFIIFFIFDTVLGVSKGIKKKNFSSTKLRQAIPKLLGYVLTIISCVLLDILAAFSTDLTIFAEYSPISIAATVLICVIEFVSIVENSHELGAKLPKFLLNLIKLFNNEIFEENE